MTKLELSELTCRIDERVQGLEEEVKLIKSTLSRIYITVFTAILSVIVMIIQKFI